MQMLPDLPNMCMSSAYQKDQQNDHLNVVTASINVGSINYEHAWYIAKMEGIVSVFTAVDTASLSAL